jgi:hypothetical protein
MITEQDLIDLGFVRLMSDYYRKDDYGLLCGHDEQGAYFVNFNSIIRTFDELFLDYWLKTGDHLE